MPDRHDGADTDGQGRERAVSGTETVEAYEVDEGVVLHDTEDPFAWVEATLAVDLHEAT
jgi:hypothetical protein